VADVVEKAPDDDGLGLSPGQSERIGHQFGDPVDSQRMLEAGVVRARKNEVGEPGLSNPPQTLKRRMTDELEGSPRYGDRAMDRIENRFPTAGRLCPPHVVVISLEG
jgi:hypothetical protein